MGKVVERRVARRFSMTLPLSVRNVSDDGAVERPARTRDVSSRGLYFLSDESYEPGAQLEFLLTLPRDMTRSVDVRIRCVGRIVRVESHPEKRGVAARIERYEFLPVSS